MTRHGQCSSPLALRGPCLPRLEDLGMRTGKGEKGPPQLGKVALQAAQAPRAGADFLRVIVSTPATPTLPAKRLGPNRTILSQTCELYMVWAVSPPLPTSGSGSWQ